jgi:hypothetical protein
MANPHRRLNPAHRRRALELLASSPHGANPHGDGTGLRFETGEHGGDYPDNMPRKSR